MSIKVAKTQKIGIKKGPKPFFSNMFSLAKADVI